MLRLGRNAMTLREATIQACVELGMSRQDAELKARSSDGFLPGSAGLSQSPVKPGTERAFIDALKQMLGKVEANGEAVRAVTRSKIGKRAKKN
jgi:hypothetical protein